MTGEACHAATAVGIARSRHLVVVCEPSQLDPRVDAEFREDVAEMAVHGMRRDEQSLGYFTVGEPLGNEPGDRELRRSQCSPALVLWLGGVEAPPNPELPQAAAYPPCVPGGADFGVEGEAVPERLDCGVPIRGKSRARMSAWKSNSAVRSRCAMERPLSARRVGDW